MVTILVTWSLTVQNASDTIGMVTILLTWSLNLQNASK